MQHSQRGRSKGKGWRITLAGVLATFLLIAATKARTQTFNVIYDFSPANGSMSTGTLFLDGAGRLYGTLQQGLYGNCNFNGSAFQLKPVGSGWTLNPLHCFVGGDNDGAYPIDHGGLTIGPDGALYGTTSMGGISNGAYTLGVVFKLSPPARVCTRALCPWTETLLYEFQGPPDGALPHGNVAFDAAGNLYGTTFEGGAGYGIVFELTPSGSGWTENILYSFTTESGGTYPEAGVVVDSAGNVYGVGTRNGQHGQGSVYKLSRSGSGWTLNTIYSFLGGSDGAGPVGGLVLDEAGNLYGSTAAGGVGNGGTVFQLSPSGDNWTETTLCSFTGSYGSYSSLTLDAAANLYGTTYRDGALDGGSVFKVTWSGSNWTCTELHDFQQGTGGVNPIGGVTVAPNGKLYGTTSAGGAYGNGVVWEITP